MGALGFAVRLEAGPRKGVERCDPAERRPGKTYLEATRTGTPDLPGLHGQCSTVAGAATLRYSLDHAIKAL